jgi:hypothetical protein
MAFFIIYDARIYYFYNKILAVHLYLNPVLFHKSSKYTTKSFLLEFKKRKIIL